MSQRRSFSYYLLSGCRSEAGVAGLAGACLVFGVVQRVPAQPPAPCGERREAP